MQKSTVETHEASSPGQSASAFRGFEHAFRAHEEQHKQDLKAEAAQFRQAEVKRMTETRISDAMWDELLTKARTAAERGEKQYLMLRFPSDLCSDGSRAINNPPNPSWPETLRGEAAEMYQRWHTTLRPLGFELSAQVLDFPDGKPGDVGLFMAWGE